MATKKTSGGSKRLTTSLVALGSAVITAVYATGYVRTQPAADQLARAAAAPVPSLTIALAPSPIPSSTATPVPPSPTTAPQLGRGRSRGSVRPTVPQAPTPVPTPASTRGSPGLAPMTMSAYRDGTYVGVGNSRHGGVQVTIEIQGGKIISAAVTGCSTRYPCSAITPLPAQVVSRQSPQINFVSGATDSSMAYQTAVRDALAQASA